MTTDRRDAASPARAGGVARNQTPKESTVQHDILTEEQRRHLIGDDDTPGLLDEYKVVTYMSGEKPIIAWFCPRQHGDSTGHAGVIARNMDGDQSGLTLGELVTAALDHEIEAH